MASKDYRIIYKEGKVEPKGSFRLDPRGRVKAPMRYTERYKTAVGTFLPEIWKELTLDILQNEGKLELLGRVNDYCKTHCAWLRTDAEIEEYAIDCVCGESYKHWPDFEIT